MEPQLQVVGSGGDVGTGGADAGVIAQLQAAWEAESANHDGWQPELTSEKGAF